MILVITNEIEPWFKYIWEQFAIINSLQTEYRLTTYADSGYLDKAGLILEYADSQRYPNSLFIPMKKKFKTDDYIWIQEDLPVYRSTIYEDNNYDILYNAFVHLSRLEEWESEKNGRLIHSYSSRHPRKNKKIWKIPIVNFLFNEFEAKIKEKHPAVTFGSKAKPVIEFSHDVDYLEKTPQLRIKQSLFNILNIGKLLLHLKIRKGILKFFSGIEFIIRNRTYWCFDYWVELENKLNIKSVYYFFAKSAAQKGFSLRQWLIDPSYDIMKNNKLKEKCKELMASSNRIGLHGSCYSAEDEELFIKEKEVLESSLDCKITRTRQHWLNYYEDKTPYIHQIAGIQRDSTIGFNDIPGFRAGIASEYNPYDHRNQKAFAYKEIPLVLMDSHIYNYSNGDDDMRWLFECFEKVRKVEVSINWHQRVVSLDYGWNTAYESILNAV